MRSCLTVKLNWRSSTHFLRERIQRLAVRYRLEYRCLPDCCPGGIFFFLGGGGSAQNRVDLLIFFAGETAVLRSIDKFFDLFRRTCAAQNRSYTFAAQNPRQCHLGKSLISAFGHLVKFCHFGDQFRCDAGHYVRFFGCP